ncbi:MAG: hypothetical protein KME23_07640 [Goleter apudmare HA4340-LM2]|nr:hypothetical protein [Goleter apudmare HA4340-LM2]
MSFKFPITFDRVLHKFLAICPEQLQIENRAREEKIETRRQTESRRQIKSDTHF